MDKAPAISIAVYGRTDVGLIREHNEDNFLVADLERNFRSSEIGKPVEFEIGSSGALFIVCDGMGGAAAGEVASQMAVDSIAASMSVGPPPERTVFARQLRGAIEDANDKIYAQSRDNQSERGMGTTCTAAALVDDTLVLGQIGDSRCYVMREGRLAQVTKDQSLAWQLIEAGAMTHEEAKAFEHANIILQALGVQERVDVVLSQVPLRRGDVILLSSDGLHGPVGDDEISEILANEPDLKKAGDMLIARALEHEGPDNVTIVLARVDGPALQPPTAADRVEFMGLDPGGEGPAPRERTEKATQEVKLPRDLDSTTENVLATMPASGRTPTPSPMPASASDNRGVMTFAIVTLLAALALGLWLRFDRQNTQRAAEANEATPEPAEKEGQ